MNKAFKDDKPFTDRGVGGQSDKRKILPVSVTPEDEEKLQEVKDRLGLKSSSEVYKRSVEITANVLQFVFPQDFNIKASSKKKKKPKIHAPE